MLSTQTSIDAYCEQAVQLFCDVFRTMLHVEISPCPEPLSPPPDPIVTSAVYFAGSWKGAALLECNLDLGIYFTERLMPGCHPTSFDDDVKDCLGELANMVGGNIKALLPDGAELSIPSVIEGRNYSVRLCGNNSFLRLPFACEAGTFVVIIVEVARSAS